MKHIHVTEVPEHVQLIDVREVDEFDAVHAVGAKNVPLSEFTERYSEIDLDKPVYVICKSGGRSAQACQYLEQALNAQDITNVEGGTEAWVAAGLKAEGSEV